MGRLYTARILACAVVCVACTATSCGVIASKKELAYNSDYEYISDVLPDWPG
jgi:hypothetical protein